MINQSTRELMHHGVIGQKWGVRRYQPYGEGGYDPKKPGKFVGKQSRKQQKENYEVIQMNDFCKDCLYHAWGKSPEQKRLEKEYNAKYYSQNKNKWVLNKLRRSASGANGPRPDAPIGPYAVDTIVSGTFDYVNSTGSGNTNSPSANSSANDSGAMHDGLVALWKATKATAKFAVKAAKKLMKVGEAAGEAVASVPEFMDDLEKRKILGAPIRAIKNSKVVKDIKKFFKIIGESESDMSEYF